MDVRILAGLLAVLVVTIAAMAPLQTAGDTEEHATPGPAAGQTGLAGYTEERPTPEAPTLQAELDDYTAGLQGRYGVAVMSLDDGSAAYVNADESFRMASMYKLLVMYRVYQQVEEGELSLQDRVDIEPSDVIQYEPESGFSVGDSPTVAEALDGMTTISSNAAALALTRTVGGWGMVISAADEVGMQSTTLENEEFWSTPTDLLTFFEVLESRSLVSESASEQMIELLRRQGVNDRIPALLPEGVEVAHKTGNLPGVSNDGGIVWGPGGSYLIVMMSGEAPASESTQALAEMSRIAYLWYGR